MSHPSNRGDRLVAKHDREGLKRHYRGRPYSETPWKYQHRCRCSWCVPKRGEASGVEGFSRQELSRGIHSRGARYDALRLRSDD